MAFGDIVQTKAAESISITFDSTPTAGNLIVLCAVDLGQALAAGTGLTQAVKVNNVGAGDDHGIYFRVVQGGDGATWANTGTGPYYTRAYEIEGPWESSPYDVSATNAGGYAPATQSTGTTGSTAQASAFAIAQWMSRDTTPVTFSGYTNSFTELADATYTYGVLAIATKVLSATGTVETTATLTSAGGGQSSACIAVFKAGATGTSMYFLDSAAPGSNFGQLQVGGSAPSTATTATGWTVDTVASGNHALLAYASERASTTFSGTAQPAGNPDNSLGDCFRSTSTLTGDFATGVWTIAIPVIAVSAAAGQDGRVRVRLWKSANATGTTPTEITSGAVAGTTVTDLTTGAEQVSTVTTSSITGFSMANEYLFVQIAWEITGAAT